MIIMSIRGMPESYQSESLKPVKRSRMLATMALYVDEWAGLGDDVIARMMERRQRMLFICKFHEWFQFSANLLRIFTKFIAN